MMAPGVKLRVAIFYYIDPFFSNKNHCILRKNLEVLEPSLVETSSSLPAIFDPSPRYNPYS